jgi:hypothetical protein
MNPLPKDIRTYTLSEFEESRCPLAAIVIPGIEPYYLTRK